MTRVRSSFATCIGPAKPTPETDVSWRQIEDDWLGGAETLGLALDSATNNTSLVLAIEVKASKQVLLFPADAQVGNWLSWQNVEWDHVYDGGPAEAHGVLQGRAPR